MGAAGPGEVDQDAFTQPVFAHHAPRGVQLFHMIKGRKRGFPPDSLVIYFIR